ncbi:MAG: hypothetical protein HOP02_14645 [Methylococcaceae bacterium]|nr:hypothetical protein [Methylococcaceae bacterium]
MKAKGFIRPIMASIFLIILVTACLSPSPQQDNIQKMSLSQTTPPLKYVKSEKFLKTTMAWCENHRGEYTPHKNILPEDMVDCLLPGTRGEKRQLLGNAYDYLYRNSIEKSGYGLYSYVLLPTHSSRGERFLEALFKTTSFVDLIKINVGNLNLIYLPTKANKLSALIPSIADGSAPPVDLFAKQFYDYALAQGLLAQICTSPTIEIKAVCESDLSRGPYLFTYTQPASSLAPASPPYLFVDLSSVHEAAFGELISAYKEQVKRSDFSDLIRINNFKERLLSIMLTAADTINPITDAIKNAIHMVKGDSAVK